MINKDEIIRLYREGFSTYKVAEKLNCSRSYICIVLKNRNIPFYPKGYFNKGKKTWNSGLTVENSKLLKEQSERMKLNNPMSNLKNREKISEIKKMQYKEGKLSPWNLGKHHSEKTKRILEEKVYSKKRDKTYEEIYGKERADDIKKRKNKSMKKTLSSSDAKKLKSKRAYENFKDPKFLKNYSNGMAKKPNKKELILIRLIQEKKFPFRYVGNFSYWVCGKNPDFISTSKNKKIIEMFGDYWHNKPEVVKKDKDKLSVYSKEGFSTLIIWEKELNNLNNVSDKIKNFIKCGEDLYYGKI